ncbi:MAG: MqnA/MqnD/SBP family protein [Bdellovibrionota bacterium]
MSHVNAKPSVDRILLGWIPYWNMLPFYRELSRNGENIQFVTGSPVQINSHLKEGKVKIAPSSSVCLLTDARSEIAVPYGVSCDGPVQSVYIGFQHEHEEVFAYIESRLLQIRGLYRQAHQMHGFDVRKISQFMWEAASILPKPACELIPTICMSKSSASSVILAKILYKLCFGDNAFTQLCERDSSIGNLSIRAPLEVVIGDEALMRKTSFYKILDLGEAWKLVTDLPFVFSIWQCHGEFLNGWRRRICKCGELASAKMKVEPTSYFPDSLPVDENGRPINLASYWANINYKLGPKEFKGLSLFLSLARDLKPQLASQVDLVKLLRWQDFGINGNIPRIV